MGTNGVLKSLIAALLLTATALAVSLPASAQDAPSAPPGFAIEWRKLVPPLRDLAISPQGTRIALLTADSKLAVWDAITPAPLWAKPEVDGTDIYITDGIGYVVLFDQMNPIDTEVDLFNAATGKLASRSHADSAIWDVAVSESGETMAVGTGNGGLYIYTLDMNPNSTRYQLRGVCNDLSISPNGQYIVSGLWNGSGVDWFDTTGHLVSSQTADATQRFETCVSGNSKQILGLQYDNHEHRNPVMTMWKVDGTKRWQLAIGKDAFNARALVSRTGDYTVASFYRMIVRDHAWIPERRLLLVDGNGQELAQIGGLYLSLTLMFLAPDSKGFVAYDGDRALYRFDRQGNAVSKWPLTSPIRAWAVTADNKRLVVHTTDNQLTMLRVR